MTRCFLIAASARLFLAFILLAWLAPASAQMPIETRVPPVSARAVSGVLRIVAPPEVLLNGQPARLAPGSRIRDRHNLIVMPATLVHLDLRVRYTLDPLGLVLDVWVLTESEVAAEPPLAPQYFSR